MLVRKIIPVGMTFLFLVYLSCYSGGAGNEIKVVRFLNIKNTGLNGIEGHDTIISNKSDSDYFQITLNRNRPIRVEYLRNKTAVPFKCPYFYNPFIDIDILTIEINYLRKLQKTVINFIDNKGKTFFVQTINNRLVELSYVGDKGQLQNNDSGIAKVT